MHNHAFQAGPANNPGAEVTPLHKPGRSKIDFKAINEAADGDRLGLLRKWLPNGQLNGKEYEVGNLEGDKGRSLKINVETGKWRDFEADQGGNDMISLYAAINKMKQGEAATQLAADLGMTDYGDGQPPARKPRNANKPTPSKPKPKPILPVPDNAPAPSFTHNAVFLGG